MELNGVSPYIQVSTGYKHHGANLADQTSSRTLKTLNVTSFIFNVISLHSERQKRGSCGWVLITSATARVTLMRGMNLSTKLHGITFKTTITFTFTAVKISNIILMIFGAEYEIMDLLISATHD
jgi:hypothetical protein